MHGQSKFHLTKTKIVSQQTAKPARTTPISAPWYQRRRGPRTRMRWKGSLLGRVRMWRGRALIRMSLGVLKTAIPKANKRTSRLQICTNPFKREQLIKYRICQYKYLRLSRRQSTTKVEGFQLLRLVTPGRGTRCRPWSFLQSIISGPSSKHLQPRKDWKVCSLIERMLIAHLSISTMRQVISYSESSGLLSCQLETITRVCLKVKRKKRSHLEMIISESNHKIHISRRRWRLTGIILEWHFRQWASRKPI